MNYKSLSVEQLSEFFFNIHDTNSIITGGNTDGQVYCPQNCTFCICKGEADRVKHKIPFIDPKLMLLGITFVDWAKKKVYLGDGISRLSAEAFAHPEIYEVLEMVCRGLPEHEITIMTCGTFIKMDKIDLLNKLKNLHVSLSVNTLDPEYRKQLMPNSPPGKIKELLGSLDRVGVQMFDVGDTSTLERDLREINDVKKIERFQLRRIEHTKNHDETAKHISARSINNFENSLRFIKKKHKKATYWAPYLRYDLDNTKKMRPVYRYLDAVLNFIVKHEGSKILFCSSESSHEMWSVWLRGHAIDTLEIKNISYGGSVTVCGLMMFEDIEHAINKNNKGGYDYIMLPSIMVNKAYEDLSGRSVIDFHKSIGVQPTFL